MPESEVRDDISELARIYKSDRWFTVDPRSRDRKGFYIIFSNRFGVVTSGLANRPESEGFVHHSFNEAMKDRNALASLHSRDDFFILKPISKYASQEQVLVVERPDDTIVLELDGIRFKCLAKDMFDLLRPAKFAMSLKDALVARLHYKMRPTLTLEALAEEYGENHVTIFNVVTGKTKWLRHFELL